MRPPFSGEHFSSVQILASWPIDGGGTRASKWGVGDWYARQGMAHAFINTEQAEELSDQIAKKLDPPDESDAWKAN
jgi:hypothetical protein